MSSETPAEPGYYWAKLISRERDWQPVEVYGRADGRLFVVALGDEAEDVSVAEWGPRITPPAPRACCDVPTLVAELAGRRIKAARIQPMEAKQPKLLPAALTVECDDGYALHAIVNHGEVHVRTADGIAARAYGFGT